MTRIVHVNGRYLPEDQATVSIFDRGFLMADGVYEVVSVLDGRLLDFEGHMKRLARSLDELGMSHPMTDEEWLEAHPNVKFHFTPTSASWLNQVEVWFSILQGQSLSGASFTSLKQLEQHIDAYIKAYNVKAEPFVWTKKKVRQRKFKGRRITQL